MNNLIKIFKALSDPNRLRVFYALLHQKELCGCDLMELLEVTGATVSNHMSLLKDAELVKSEKRGRWVYYSMVESTDVDIIVHLIKDKLADDSIIEKDNDKLTNITSCKGDDSCKTKK